MRPDAINSGYRTQPLLRFDLNAGTLLNPPARWTGPRVGDDLGQALLEAGYEGLQDHAPRAEVLARGLKMTGMARVTEASQAEGIARRHRDWGFQATTLHLGDGLESDAEAAALAEAVLEASARCGHPLFVETHRATVTQDMRRTLDLVERFPELRFTADLSHWYTGCELTYGDLGAKLERLQPIFARVRFLHGRIGDSCVMQRPLPTADEPFVGHFRAMWTLCFAGFLGTATAGDEIVFAPELLPATAEFGGQLHRLNYARLTPDGDEESDRWADALRLCLIARDCFDAACASLRRTGHDCFAARASW